MGTLSTKILRTGAILVQGGIFRSGNSVGSLSTGIFSMGTWSKGMSSHGMLSFGVDAQACLDESLSASAALTSHPTFKQEALSWATEASQMVRSSFREP